MMANPSKFLTAVAAAVAIATSAGCASTGYDSQAYYQTTTYGTVSNVQYFPASGSDGATTAGFVAGGVAGGLIGHQIGKGKGKTAATILGAMGGALLGGAVAQGNAPHYLVTVQFDDGSVRQIKVRNDPGLQVGQRVAMQGGRLYR